MTFKLYFSAFSIKMYLELRKSYWKKFVKLVVNKMGSIAKEQAAHWDRFPAQSCENFLNFLSKE